MFHAKLKDQGTCGGRSRLPAAAWVSLITLNQGSVW